MVDVTSGSAAVAGTPVGSATPQAKPMQSLFAIINMAVGFFGLQIGFALQNANASRIFQSLGSEPDKLALFWLAGPVTGLIVQPIIGYMSDRTWGRYGRRRPYFFIGAILASLALIVMPYSPYLWMAAGSLWVLDSALNISMEPFRAFVGDNLNSRQRTLGYALQGFFIGAGGWLASKLPEFLTDAGVANTAAQGAVADSVKYSFIIGAGLLFVSVLWTVLSSREYDPDQLRAFEAADSSEMAKLRNAERVVPEPGFFSRWGGIGLALSLALLGVVLMGWAERQFAVFAALVGGFGAAFTYNAARLSRGGKPGMIGSLMDDFATMPLVMRRLAMVQFTSWFAFFILWVYLNSAVTSHHFGTTDTSSEAFGEGSLAVNNIFAVYSLVAWGFSLLIPFFTRVMGTKPFYALALLIGGASFAAIRFIEPDMFWLAATGIGIVWACVLTLPYTLLADALPPERMGTYMGIFNFFIVIPQLVVGTVMGAVLTSFLGGEPVRTLVVAGAVMALGALLLVFVPHKDVKAV